MLDTDTTLTERFIRLFREQRIAIVSVLTEIGMVQHLVPIKMPGVRDLVKKQLQALGRFLGKLVEKAAAVLPSIIGSVISWLFNFLSKSVGWLADNLLVLFITLCGIIIVFSRNY